MIDIKQLDTSIDGVETTKFVAIVDGHWAGFVDLKYRGLKSASFRELFVHEDYRKQGIGRMLLAKCAGTAFDAGCVTIGANVHALNHSVLPFYEKLGFFTAFHCDDGDVMICRRIRY